MPEQERNHRRRWLSNEELRDKRVSHERFMTVVTMRDVNVHKIQMASNSYGEFLFVTLDRPKLALQQPLTFFGLGYHEYRERWISNVWQFHECYLGSRKLPIIPKAEAIAHISEQEAYVKANLPTEKRSDNAKIYELLSSMSDEDAAITDLQDFDFGWMFLGKDNTE
jgi:hypothetical protein